MTAYRCIALSTLDAMRYRSATIDDFGYPIERFARHGTYPCRHCLSEASGADGMLLLSYQLSKPKSVYGHPTAIFLCAQDCTHFDRIDEIPPIVRNRHVSFRAFRSDGAMLYHANELVDGSDHDAAIRRIFAHDDVAFINAHTAKAGCMLCHVDRAQD